MRFGALRLQVPHSADLPEAPLKLARTPCHDALREPLTRTTSIDRVALECVALKNKIRKVGRDLGGGAWLARILVT